MSVLTCFGQDFGKIGFSCLFWPGLGKNLKILFFCAFWPQNHCFGQNFEYFVFFVRFGRKHSVLDKIFENLVFFVQFDRKTLKTPKLPENSGKIAGKQRENSGNWARTAGKQRENGGKTAGIGAQTREFGKLLKNPFSDTSCPKFAKFRYFSVFLPISGGIQGLKPDFVVLPPDQAEIGFVWFFLPILGSLLWFRHFLGMF